MNNTYFNFLGNKINLHSLVFKTKFFYNSRINVVFFFKWQDTLDRLYIIFFQSILVAIRTFELQLNCTKCLKPDILQQTDPQ